MNRLSVVDRLQTIAATATLTSAAWVVVGTVYLDNGGETEMAKVSAGDRTVVRPQANPAEGLTIPVPGVSAADLTDTFADDRGDTRHNAIDIMAPAGTPVVAAAPGTVERLFVSQAGGNTVYVRSPDRRTVYYYAHLQAYAPGLVEGQQVTRGQALGTVGSSGNADPAAPHLHFEILRTEPEAAWWDARAAVNPYPLLVR